MDREHDEQFNPLVPLKRTEGITPDRIVWIEGKPFISCRDMLLEEGLSEEKMREIDATRIAKGLEPMFD